MPPLPVVSGRDVVAALQRIGFEVHHQTGSHVIMRHRSLARRADVPLHRELKRGTLRGILRQSGITVADFIDLLN